VRYFSSLLKDVLHFVSGETCRLVDAVNSGGHLGDASGTVKIATTDNSVKFTVVSNDYFDAPGSTIEFRVVDRKGEKFLDQIANAHGANYFVTRGIDIGFAKVTWSTQSTLLRGAILKYGEK